MCSTPRAKLGNSSVIVHNIPGACTNVVRRYGGDPEIL